MTESIDDIKERYAALDIKLDVAGEDAIDPGFLLTFPYDYPDNPAEVVIDTHEFTAVCPWTGLPDTGDLKIIYVPRLHCLELKSLKYYLLSFRPVGIVQEHAASRILDDLVQACDPRSMSVCLDYTPRGGLHTVVTVRYPPEDSAAD
ncbi:MAG: preQ(1) synthase [Chloroflexi bacterium]|nr:preQ(1) synthase [Chloroflexota bacterium]